MGKLRSAFGRWRRTRALVLLALLGSSAVPLAVAGMRGEAEAARPALGIQDVLQNYATGLSQAPNRYVAQLTGEVQSFLGRRTFTGVVTSTEDGVSTITQGAPWYLPKDFSGDLVDISGELDQFDMWLKGVSEGDEKHGRLYHVAGVRSADESKGAERGEFWIRESDWRIVRYDVEYGWGKVDVDLTYKEVEGYLVLSEMAAGLHPFGVKLHLAYNNYQFGE